MRVLKKLGGFLRKENTDIDIYLKAFTNRKNRI